MLKWEITRQKGKKHYILFLWVIPYGLLLPFVKFLASFPLYKDSGYKDLFVIFCVLLPVSIIISILAGSYAWESSEKRYLEEKREFRKDQRVTQSFKKKLILNVSIIAQNTLVLNFVILIPIIFLLLKFEAPNKIINSYVFLSFGGFLLSGVVGIYGMLFIKNPICGHAILSNSNEAGLKESYLQVGIRILRGRSFHCLRYGNLYKFNHSQKDVNIVKLANYNSLKSL